MRGRDKNQRGFGPFTGGQLTVIIVAIAAVFAIPTVAGAAGAVFGSKSNGAPAVKGVNTGSNGVGVAGKGNGYGVFSNGPLGVANGKDLVCNGCVGGNNLSTDAKTNLPLGSGQSETGYVAGGAGNSTAGYIAGGITFTRPVTAWNSLTTATGASDPGHCPGIGSAAKGYLCSYVHQSSSSATFGGVFAFSKYGGYMYWTVTSASPTPFVSSVWTVTAP